MNTINLKQMAVNLIYGTAVVWGLVGIICGTKEVITYIINEPANTVLYLFLWTAMNAGLICLGGIVYTLVKMIEDAV